jgi:hypothetical protein
MSPCARHKLSGWADRRERGGSNLDFSIVFIVQYATCPSVQVFGGVQGQREKVQDAEMGDTRENKTRQLYV